jgi:hypothetical protein
VGLDRGGGALYCQHPRGDDVPAVVVAGPQGVYGDNDPAGFYPAEDHIRMRTVQTHGGLADLTWVLLIIALLVT